VTLGPFKQDESGPTIDPTSNAGLAPPAGAPATPQPVDITGKVQTPESATAGLPGQTGNRPVTDNDLIPGKVALGAAGLTTGVSEALDVAPSLLELATKVGPWVKANPYKALAVESIAHEMGIDPIQLAHKVIKYGTGLFGSK
jgi:hypothetical protein